MDSRQARELMEAAQSQSPTVNNGYSALATPEAVAELCRGWLLMRETLSDVASAASELEMPFKDRLEYIRSLVRASLGAL